jgi:MYXO-CTERM domain-containing protein
VSCSSGYCSRGAAGAGALGDACSADTECSSLYCDGGVCSQPCIPGGAVACPSGYTCQVGTLPCRGSCRRARPLGDRCEGNDDCSSTICAARGDETFCTQLCDADAPCPEGFSCMPAGDQSVCVPDLGGVDADCMVDADCLSGVCTTEHGGSYCTRPCATASECPGGFSCGATDSDPSVCVRDDRGLGQECSANDDCASGACAQLGGDTFCTEVCSDADPCPMGFECVSAGATQVCRSGAMPPPSPGCGCHVGGAPAPPLAPWIVGLAALLWRRRR